ncbi:prophage tail fiber family protein [Shigella dysenteriae 155-74]|nr:prophage tail fiber family protein [Shigella dysenteriae 155-74]
MRTVAEVVTGADGEYSFEAQTGKYCVYLKPDWRDEYCVGDIAVYDDSKPGTLNDFLIAPDEGDLKPDVVKRFEEMVAQGAAECRGVQPETHSRRRRIVAAAATARDDAQRFAEKARQDATVTAEDRKATAEDVTSTGAKCSRSRTERTGCRRLCPRSRTGQK